MAAKRPAEQQEEEASPPRADTVGETASEGEDNDATTSSGEDFELRIVHRGAPAAASTSEDAQSASDDAASAAEAETERSGNKCAFCSSRKVKACSNLACKRCCVRMDQECAVHSKVSEAKPKGKVVAESVATEALQPLRKARKAVLKNEFKESSVLYYGETVTLFCLRDFLHAKQLSQSLLNDQTRRLRASAAAAPMTEEGEQKEKVRGKGGLETKAQVMDALRDAKRRKIVSAAH